MANKIGLVANFQGSKKYPFEKIERDVRAQLENCVSVGWRPEDVLLVTNFQYEYMGVKAINADLNSRCLTGSKMFGIKYLIDSGIVKDDDIVWMHDLDVWQIYPVEFPEFPDIGISEYSTSKMNGGSVFYKTSGIDIINEVVDEIKANSDNKEEPSINKVFKLDKNKERVKVVDNTFNVGCSGFKVRYEKASKPIKAVHFHPTNRIAFDTHCRDRDRVGQIAVNTRLHSIFLKYYMDVIKNYQYPEDERGYPGDWHPPYPIKESHFDK
jgi:hypothetical protein